METLFCDNVFFLQYKTMFGFPFLISITDFIQAIMWEDFFLIAENKTISAYFPSWYAIQISISKTDQFFCMYFSKDSEYPIGFLLRSFGVSEKKYLQKVNFALFA